MADVASVNSVESTGILNNISNNNTATTTAATTTTTATAGATTATTTTNTTRHRPPKLDLKRATPGTTPATTPGPTPSNDFTTKANSEPTAHTTHTIITTAPLPSPGYRTPKDIANDIAIQCVSPGLPPFMKDAFLRSKSIEAQQRMIIAQRMANIGNRKEEDADSIISSNIPVSSTATGSAATATTTTTSTIVSIPPHAPEILKTPSSLRRMNRAPRPVNIKVYPSGTTSFNNKFPDPLSAPIIQHYSSPPYTGIPKLSPPRRSIVREQNQTQYLTIPSKNNMQTTTMYVPPVPPGRAMSAIDPSARMRAIIAREREERLNAVRGISQENNSEDEDEDEDDGRDPEDAALSDSEQTSISDRPRKRTRVMSAESGMQKPASIIPESETPTTKSHSNRLSARKEKFMELCEQMWDLINDPTDDDKE